ncbi:MAG: hypothetical protein IPH82_05985 [Chloroflexi bacterium]|nr:hypothetical protein [Chloroflexota bacterium]
MFQFPSPPDTLVTRQVECVCCRELFTVAEDVVNLTPGLSEFWRMSPDQYTDIRQRFDPSANHNPNRTPIFCGLRGAANAPRHQLPMLRRG